MATPQRTTGAPASSNGASSFHLHWQVPDVRLQSVETTIEVVEPPSVHRLSFWALQVTFRHGDQTRGSAHFGLQHHPAYPDSGAVNWGGYHDPSVHHGELPGSHSRLSSTLGNPNTFDYHWRAGSAYRYRIAPTPEGDWRGSIIDLETGVERVVRDLHVRADHLTAPMVWSEVFADCDDPSSAVRWSDFAATDLDGRVHHPATVRVTYQSVADGGCSNTDAEALGNGRFLQRTNTERRTPHGSVIGY